MVRSSSGEERWRCSVSGERSETTADTAKLGGTGDGFRPHEFLEAALASCLNITVRMRAEEEDIPLEGVTTNVDLRRSKDRTGFVYSCTFEGVSESEAAALRDAVSNCPVRETLSKELTFERAD